MVASDREIGIGLPLGLPAQKLHVHAFVEAVDESLR
jgi:hypothetical protein